MSAQTLRELMLRSTISYRTLHLDCEAWFDMVALNALHASWFARTHSASGESAKAIDFANEGGSFASHRRLQAEWKVWWRRPNCWRDELRWLGGITTVSLACDGDATAQPTSGVSDDVQERVTEMPLVQPDVLAKGWLLEELGDERLASRAAIRVRAKRQGHAADFGFLPYLDEYDVVVDRDYGVLLRCAAIANGAEVAVVLVRRAEFNLVIPDRIFQGGASPEGSR